MMLRTNIADDDASDVDTTPQLKFKVPNFLGSLTERRRPVFASSTYSALINYKSCIT